MLNVWDIYIYMHLHLGKKIHHPLGFNWYPGLEVLYMNGIHQNIYIYIDVYRVNHVYDCMIVERERERQTSKSAPTQQKQMRLRSNYLEDHPI